MNMSSEGLLVILFVGLVAGWLAGQIVQGTGFEMIGDLIVGVLGAFIGSWLLAQLGIHLGTGLISAIVNATIGAILLLLIVRLLRGGSGWGSRWGGNSGRRSDALAQSASVSPAGLAGLLNPPTRERRLRALPGSHVHPADGNLFTAAFAQYSPLGTK